MAQAGVVDSEEEKDSEEEESKSVTTAATGADFAEPT